MPINQSSENHLLTENEHLKNEISALQKTYAETRSQLEKALTLLDETRDQLAATTAELKQSTIRFEKHKELHDVLQTIMEQVHFDPEDKTPMHIPLKQAIDALATAVEADAVEVQFFSGQPSLLKGTDSDISSMRNMREQMPDLSSLASLARLDSNENKTSLLLIPLWDHNLCVDTRETIGIVTAFKGNGAFTGREDDEENASDATHTMGEIIEAYQGHEALREAHKKNIAQTAKMTKMEDALALQKALKPNIPEIPGFSIGFDQIPSDDIAGDYGSVVVSDGILKAVIADGTGHGVLPGMTVYGMHHSLHTSLRIQGEKATTASTMKHAGDQMLENLPEGQQITVTTVFIDLKSKQMSYTNAGHGPAFIYRRATNSFETIETTNFPFGIMKEDEFESKNIQLDSGDIVVLCTDGIPEALNEEGKFYGIEKLYQKVVELKDQSGQQIACGIADDARCFTGKPTASDDITAVVVRVG